MIAPDGAPSIRARLQNLRRLHSSNQYRPMSAQATASTPSGRSIPAAP